jgi:hypothetical protein
MTTGEAIRILSQWPADTLLCVSRGDQHGTIEETERLELVPVNADGDFYTAIDDGATAVVVVG